MAAPHQYRICAANPEARLFEVAVTVVEPEPGGQTFAFPAWVPGSYLIRDMARHIVSIEATCDGEPVSLEKTDKRTWVAGPCEAPLTVTATIHAWDLSVRGAHLDTTHGFFDGACVFPAVVGQEDAECRLEIEPPKHAQGGDWRVATSMPSANAGRYEFGAYAAADYAELIDHPVEMGDLLIGEFEASGIPHTIAVRGHTQFDMARLCHDLAKLCEAQHAFLGVPDNLDRYVFLVAARDKGYGGLEHRWSTALMCSRSDLPRRGQSKVTEDYRKFLGLCSHEYFHLWNVKRMKPARFTPYDLGVESHTGLLWVFEGITSYYDDLFLVRSGLVSAESYLDLLAKTITRVQRTPGRLRQSVEASSFDAWTGLYKQDANSPNAIISYYSKGSLVALALDMTIRKESAGRYSLDDVVREAWSRYGDSSDGMPERGLESIARDVTGLELEDFFERYVRGTAEVPLEGLLKSVGMLLRFRPATDSKDSGGKPAGEGRDPLPWLGATLDDNGGPGVFRVVFSDSPAERAGIAPGDEAVAIDGYRLTAGNLDERLRDYREGDKATITVFRDHVLMRHRVVLGTPPEDTGYLVIDGDAAEPVLAQRRHWLGTD
jgi:predicted metalloprotease with PDZ domain